MSCLLPDKYISTSLHKLFQNKKATRPLALITYGPTGSGKVKLYKLFWKVKSQRI